MLGKLLEEEIESTSEIIFDRIKGYFSQSDEELSFELANLDEEDNSYANFVKEHDLCDEERIVLLLALCPEIAPQTLDPFLSKNSLYDLPYTEFGGATDRRGFSPTIATALFVLAGVDTTAVLEALNLFYDDNKLFKNNILTSPNNSEEEPLLQSKLSLSKQALHKILNRSEEVYDYSKEFPAQKLESDFKWEDLIFSEFTADHLDELDTWLTHHNELLNDWGMKKSLKRGYKALFYGPPGTGKSLTATLLGKKINKDVYRIDLSQIVSKYIGETEKNLEKVFIQAQKEDWILFFDEADSLFGKRTQVSSSNDRHANQGTSYLLQRIDECDNMIILASNLKDNFDEAYLRRFQSIIYFPLPEKKERLVLWEKGFSPKACLDNIDLDEISTEYELSGATIMNVIRYASLMAIKRDSNKIMQSDIIKGIRREKFKEGKII